VVDVLKGDKHIEKADPLFFAKSWNFLEQREKPTPCEACDFHKKPYGWEDQPDVDPATGQVRPCDVLLILPGPTARDVSAEYQHENKIPFGDGRKGSWWLLKKILGNAATESGGNYRTKVVFAAPCRGSTAKTPMKVLRYCGTTYLQRKVHLFRPRAILALGVDSAKGLGFSPKKLMDVRGKIDYLKGGPDGPIPIVFTYEPDLFFFAGKEHKVLETFLIDLRKAAMCGQGLYKPENLDEWAKKLEFPQGDEEIIAFCRKLTNRSDIKLAFDIETTGLWHWYDEAHVAELQRRYDAANGDSELWSRKVLNKLFQKSSPTPAQVLALSFAWDKDKGGAFSTVGLLPETWDVIKELLESSTPKVAHNGKFDMSYLRVVRGIHVKRLVGDTLLSQHLVDENRNGHPSGGEYSLKRLVWDYDTTFGGYEEGTGIKDILSSLGDIDEPTRRKMLLYAAIDALVTWRLYRTQTYLLHGEDPSKEGVKFVPSKLFNFSQTFLPKASETIADMEVRGIRLDLARVNYLLDLYADLQRKEEAGLKNQLLLIGKDRMNWRSGRQLQELLFSTLKLPKTKFTKGGAFSTDATALEALKDQHPVVAHILHMKKLEKLTSSFLLNWKTFAKRIGKDHWQLYPGINLDGTVTGRLSAKDPAIQTIPDWKKFKELAKGYKLELAEFDLKTCIIPAPGMVFVYADFSQQEVRVLASYCKEGKLPSALQVGGKLDVHSLITSIAEGLKYEEVELGRKDETNPRAKEFEALRKQYKNVTFAITYGGSEHTLFERYGIPLDEGEKLFQEFFERFPEVEKYIAESHEMAKSKAYASTEYHRRRHFPIFQWTGWNPRACRQAQNSRIQSTSSDICLEAVMELNTRLQEQGCGHVAITVHDSIISEVPRDKVKEALRLYQEVMTVRPTELHPWLRVPLVIDLAIGSSWGKMTNVSVDESDWDAKISKLT
jgi:DNA polymerase I-like protein with 3'-5' exonuclease and polymerase domains/uracil-DNA glycosylase